MEEETLDEDLVIKKIDHLMNQEQFQTWESDGTRYLI